MSFDSDAGFVPATGPIGIYFLIKAGADPAGWTRFWSGFTDRLMPANSVDTSGGLYVGRNFPTNLPDFDLAVNSQMSSLELVFKGVNAKALAMSTTERALLFRAPLHMGVQQFDGFMQPAGPVRWLQRGICGWVKTERDGMTRSVTLPVRMGLYDRNDSKLTFWSPNNQRRRKAGDRMMDQTPGMVAGQLVDWPQVR